MLIIYNEEDCRALKLLTDKISKIRETADLCSDVNFADLPKKISTEIGDKIHNQFQAVLQFARADYDKNKIIIQKSNTEKTDQSQGQFENNPKKRGPFYGHKGHCRVIPKARKIVYIPMVKECQKCLGEPLRPSKKVLEKTIIDLVFTKSGCRKIIVKYMAVKGRCNKCNRYYSPCIINNFGEQLFMFGQFFMFGLGLQAWVIYQRLFLRLPYRAIVQEMEELFREKISASTAINFLIHFASYHSDTEKILIQKILKSPFIHADETPISIQGANYYVWVFTDGKHVIFKMTETREATIAHDFLSGYDGILISDFYAGYDSIQCKQQKCWVHLIRDLNDDLWGNPFDVEFEDFVLEVKNLLMPIFEVIEKFGSKQRSLNKFKSVVDNFYSRIIIEKNYYSELTIKYQKRFERYKGSLFTFLENDFIPWNNNMAERAIRHLAVQRKISGSFFESGVNSYLTLLGIMQTCKFQEKSFLRFLLSGERNIDQYKESKFTATKNTIIAITKCNSSKFFPTDYP